MAISILQDAVKNGKFGDFIVSAITGTRDTGITTTMSTTPTSSSDSMLHNILFAFFPVNLFVFLFFCFVFQSLAFANYEVTAW